MENKPSVEGMMQKVKDWSNTPEYDKPVEFLKAAVNQYSFGDWGLNQLPFIHYPHVAKVMHDYTAELQSQLAAKEKEIEGLNRVISKMFADSVENGRECQRLKTERDKFEGGDELKSKKIEELEAWKREAVIAWPDIQAIGKALHVPLGYAVHDKILPGIEKLLRERDHCKALYENAKQYLPQVGCDDVAKYYKDDEETPDREQRIIEGL